MQMNDPYSRYDWLVEHFGLLFAAGDPRQQIGAWLMFFATGFFPAWILGTSFYALVKRRFAWLHPAEMIATSLHVGRIRPAPGTWGSLFTIYLLVWLIFAPEGNVLNPLAIPVVILAATVLIIPIGTWASGVYARRHTKDDPSEVVIDEVAGILVGASVMIIGWGILLHQDMMAFRPFLVLWPGYLAVLFLLFRLFDIWKPGLIGRADRNLKGGWGIMADDLLAGLLAGLVFWAIFFAMKESGAFLWIYKIWFPDWVGIAPETPLPSK